MPIITTDDGSGPQQPALQPTTAGEPALKARRKPKRKDERGLAGKVLLAVIVAVVGYAGWMAIGGRSTAPKAPVATVGQPAGNSTGTTTANVSVSVARAGEAPDRVPEWAGRSAIPWDAMPATAKVRILDK